MKEQIIKILESYIVDNIGETSPKIDIDTIPSIADEILALQLQQTSVIRSNCIDESPEPRINVNRFNDKDYNDGYFMK